MVFQPLVQGLRSRLEADYYAVPLHEIAVALVHGEAASRGDHSMDAFRRLYQGLPFHVSEGGLAAFGKDVFDGLARPFYYQVVYIQELPAKSFGNLPADRGLARTGESGDKDAALHRPLLLVVVAPSWTTQGNAETQLS